MRYGWRESAVCGYLFIFGYSFKEIKHSGTDQIIFERMFDLKHKSDITYIHKFLVNIHRFMCLTR